MGSSRGSLDSIVYGEILDLGSSENDILVWFLDGRDVLFWRPIAQMVNGVSTQSMDRAIGIPSRLGSHRVHLTRERFSLGTTEAGEPPLNLAKGGRTHHWTAGSSTRGGQCPQGYRDIAHQNGRSKRLVFCQERRAVSISMHRCEFDYFAGVFPGEKGRNLKGTLTQ